MAPIIRELFRDYSLATKRQAADVVVDAAVGVVVSFASPSLERLQLERLQSGRRLVHRRLTSRTIRTDIQFRSENWCCIQTLSVHQFDDSLQGPEQPQSLNRIKGFEPFEKLLVQRRW